MAHRDYIGRELKPGDAVVMTTPSYSSICIGTVVEFTPKKVRVKFMNTWNYSKPTEFTILVESKTLYKADGPDFVEYLLKNSG